jgi:hypothetical protein
MLRSSGARCGVAFMAIAGLSLFACGESFASGPEEPDAAPNSGGSSGSGASGGSSPSGGSGGGGATDSGPALDSATDDAEPAPAIPTNGLLLWLRADRGVIEEDGLVASWEDQSGNGSHASQTVSNARPKLVNGGFGELASLEFDGVDDFLRLPSGFADFRGGVSIFAVVQQTTATNCTAIIEMSNGIELDDISFGQYESGLYYEVFELWTPAGQLIVGAPQLVAAIHRSNITVEVRQNGQLAGQDTFDLPVVQQRHENFVGQSLYTSCLPFHGRIAELILYARAVSDVELLAIEAYLRDHAACCDG